MKTDLTTKSFFDKRTHYKPHRAGYRSKDWLLRSKFIRTVRARSHCEHCGAPHGAPHPITGQPIRLEAAHLFGHTYTKTPLMHLAALCQYCHRDFDTLSKNRKNVRSKSVFSLLLGP